MQEDTIYMLIRAERSQSNILPLHEEPHDHCSPLLELSVQKFVLHLSTNVLLVASVVDKWDMRRLTLQT